MIRWLSVIICQVMLSALVAAAPNCPMCRKPIVPSRAVYMVVTVGNEEHRLTVRCVQCALHAVNRWRPDHILLRTRCAATKRWVRLEWAKGQWHAEPSSAVLLLAPEFGSECLHRHMVFTSPKAARKFFSRNPTLKQFPLRTIAQLPEIGK